MSQNQPALEFLEAFLAGEIGVRPLCQKLERLDLPPAEIVRILAHFEKGGRLPPRTARLIRQQLVGLSPEMAEPPPADQPSAAMGQDFSFVRPILKSREAVASPPHQESSALPPDLQFNLGGTEGATRHGSATTVQSGAPFWQDEASLVGADARKLLAQSQAREAELARHGAEASLPYPPQTLARMMQPGGAALGTPGAEAGGTRDTLRYASSRNAGSGGARSPSEANGQATVDPEERITAALIAGLRGGRREEKTVETVPVPAEQPETSLETVRCHPGAGPARPASEAELAPGHMLKERFVIERLIGEGGMGKVFCAVDRRRVEVGDSAPYVALKVVAPRFRNHPDALRSLEVEARKVQHLSHPNICPIFDFDRDGPHAFFVMELLQGQTMEAALAHAEGQPLSLNLRSQIVTGLIAAMSHVHRRGVVHGDLKPSNFFLCDDGHPKVLDFGVATALRGDDFDAASLQAFTPAFASPEMMGGAPRDPRDDVFSIGCLIYVAWTGRHPYRRVPANQARDMGLTPQPVEQMPAEAQDALMTALAFDRAQRPADAAALGLAMLPSLIRYHRAVSSRRREVKARKTDGMDWSAG
ncbi:serine/threonine-protein kinase [Xanthobacter sp. TB0139]|uniref:serine/threonine-protein kinase n=1 Tax=Xanthobacter sp. TB0139 TaxID=3459178 RepID=UPI0040395A6A